ncbi:MAG: TIGR02757 family protein [Nitrospirota bacterium]
MGIKDIEKVRVLLDRFYIEHKDNMGKWIRNDPIEFPHSYDNPADIEIAGFIASSLAYGRVSLFKPVIRKILSLSNGSLYDFVVNFEIKDLSRFEDIRYRMSSGMDIACFIYFIREILRKHDSIGRIFYSLYNPEDNDIGNTLIRFVEYMLGIDSTPVYGSKIYPKGLLFLLPSPQKGSACKRLNLFLRWMVRSGDGIDFGLWRDIPPSRLIIPLDTHIAQTCRNLGLTALKTNGWKMAREITANLKHLDHDDPVKYDFALCHHSISGGCSHIEDRDRCKECILEDICIKGKHNN